MDNYTVLFYLFIALLAVLWLLLQFVNRFGNWVQYTLGLNRTGIKKIVLFLAILCFVLLDPLHHVIISVAAVVLYMVIVDKSGLKPLNNLLRSNTTYGYDNIDITDNGNVSTLKFTLKAIEELDGNTIRHHLDRCLFSFPYLETENIEIYKIDNEFRLQVNLVSQKYISSFMSYLEKSGFKTQIKNK